MNSLFTYIIKLFNVVESLRCWDNQNHKYLNSELELLEYLQSHHPRTTCRNSHYAHIAPNILIVPVQCIVHSNTIEYCVKLHFSVSSCFVANFQDGIITWNIFLIWYILLFQSCLLCNNAMDVYEIKVLYR